jgi:hypothetical protein
MTTGPSANKLRAASGSAGVRRRVFYYAASTAFQMAGAPLPLRRSLRRLNCPFRIRRSSSIGTAVSLGARGPERSFRVCCLARGGRVVWIVRLVQVGADGEAPFVESPSQSGGKAVGGYSRRTA